MYRLANSPLMNPYGFSLRGSALGQKPKPPPGVNCQATQDGGVVCSDGKVFPPG